MTRIGDRPRRVMDWKRLLLPAAWCALVFAATVLCGSAGAGDVPPQGKDAEPKPVFILKGNGGLIYSVAYSLDGKSLFTAGPRSICLWDLTTRKKVRDVLQGAELPYKVVFSQDRKRIAFTPNGGSKLRVFEASTGKEVRTFSSPDPRTVLFHTYALSPDGQFLAAVNSSPPTVHVWDLRSGRKLYEQRGPAGVAFGFVFSPDGSILAIGGSDATAHLWEARTGKEISKLIHPAESGQVRHLAFSPDGKVLATAAWGSHDLLCLWDVRSRKMLKKLGRDYGEALVAFREHIRGAIEKGMPFDEVEARAKVLDRLQIGGLDFAPDSRWLATAGADGFIRLWELATGKEGASWRTPTPFPLSFSPEGKTLTSGGHAPPKEGGTSSVALWDRASICGGGRTGGAVLRAEELESCWRELPSEDAAVACRAVWTLVSAPLQTIKKADEYVLTIPVADAGRIRQAITDLGARQLSVRKRALSDLAALDERARPALEAALAARPELEVHKRLESLLEKINDPLSQERLRHTRLVETLEHIGNRQAQEVLKRIAGGGLGDTAARDAAEGLKRLLKDSGAP